MVLEVMAIVVIAVAGSGRFYVSDFSSGGCNSAVIGSCSSEGGSGDGSSSSS